MTVRVAPPAAWLVSTEVSPGAVRVRRIPITSPRTARRVEKAMTDPEFTGTGLPPGIGVRSPSALALVWGPGRSGRPARAATTWQAA